MSRQISLATFVVFTIVFSKALVEAHRPVCRYGTPLNGLPTSHDNAIQCATDSDCPPSYGCVVSTYGLLDTITVCCSKVPLPKPEKVSKPQPSSMINQQVQLGLANICSFGTPIGKFPTCEEDAIQCATEEDCPKGFTCTLGGPYLDLATIAMCCPMAPLPEPAKPHNPPVKTTPKPKDPCTIQAPRTVCRHAPSMVGWYFDSMTKYCEAFVYKECGVPGSEPPPFTSKEQCQQVCLGLKPTRITAPLLFSPASPQPQPSPQQPPRRIQQPNEVRPQNQKPQKLQEPYQFRTNVAPIPQPPMLMKPQVVANQNQNINYFEDPPLGYAPCPHETPCAMANPCQLGSGFSTNLLSIISFFHYLSVRCPAYPEAKCQRNNCQRCIAQFFLNGKRVNCSTSDGSPGRGDKVGMCPTSSQGFVVCDPQYFYERPEPVLCTDDAECPLSQKCCPDPCYQGKHKTCRWPML